MNELETFAVIAAGVAVIIITSFLVTLLMQDSKHAYMVLYEDLKTFKYFVEYTPINNISHSSIIDRIKIERARKEMSEKDYRDMVLDITFIFVKRFADFIQERGSKNTNS